MTSQEKLIEIALPLMSELHRSKTQKLLKLQQRLRQLRDEVGKVCGQEKLLHPEFDYYTKGWLTTFADDISQSGSIGSLIDRIVGEYVDEDGEPFKEE